MARLRSPQIQRQEWAAESVRHYYRSTQKRRNDEFIEMMDAILDGELDFLGRFDPPTRPTASIGANGGGAIARKFTTDVDLDELLDSDGVMHVGGSLVEIDDERLNVLEQLEAEFGSENCHYARGVFDGPDGMGLPLAALTA